MSVKEEQGGDDSKPHANTSKLGRKGDPRMHRAVAARLENPNLSLFDALKEGGFEYPNNDIDDGTMVDAENVTLGQRKNQLSRRLRLARKQGKDGSSTAKSQNGKSSKRRSSLEVDVLDDDGLDDDSGTNMNADEEDEATKRQKTARYHPDFNPNMIPSSARHSFGDAASATNIDAYADRLLGGPPPSYPAASSYPPSTNRTGMVGPYTAAQLNTSSSTLPIPGMYVAPTTTTSQQRGPSSVAIASLSNTATTLGLSLEQLAMSLSTNQSSLMQLLTSSQDSQEALEKKKEMATALYLAESKALYTRCLVLSGVSPEQCGERSPLMLEFAANAWRQEGARLQQLLGHQPLADPPLTAAAASKDDKEATSNGATAPASASETVDHDHSHSHQHTDTCADHLHDQDGRHVHRLDGKCGHKAIVHQPKDGQPHIDFLIGDRVECYHGLEPVGKTPADSMWPSKYRCEDLSDKSCVDGSSSQNHQCKLPNYNGDPKVISLSDINFTDGEWNMDGLEGLPGLFKLGRSRAGSEAEAENSEGV